MLYIEIRLSYYKEVTKEIAGGEIPGEIGIPYIYSMFFVLGQKLFLFIDQLKINLQRPKISQNRSLRILFYKKASKI